jgi:hypothetical protein
VRIVGFGCEAMLKAPPSATTGYALSRQGGWIVGWHRLEQTASYTIPHPKGLRTSTLDIRNTRTWWDGAGAKCRSDEIEFCVGNGAHGERDQVVATRHGGIAIVDVTWVTLVISASNWRRRDSNGSSGCHLSWLQHALKRQGYNIALAARTIENKRFGKTDWSTATLPG